MSHAVHFRTEEGWKNYPNKTACLQGGFNVTDTTLVTCFLCQSTSAYQVAAAQFREVVEALAYPKEDHPCLNPHSSTTTAHRPSSR
ncbi:hypothetical protein SEA_BRUHMOMENT_100 [Arthrobacter phage BruhMoment]|nr:hypothetical protein SEA_BRUHMOMENT_100 [Arthrobacter phage BruhMoment]